MPEPIQNPVNPPAPQPLTLDSKIKIGDKEVPISDLFNAYNQMPDVIARLTKAEKGYNAALAITNPNTPPQAVEQHLRAFLESAAVPADKIDGIVQSTLEDDDAPQAPAGGGRKGKEAEVGQDDSQFEEALLSTIKELKNTKTDLLKTKLDEAISHYMGDAGEVGKILAAARKLKGVESLGETEDLARGELHRAALALLNAKSQSGGFSLADVPGVVKQADAVAVKRLSGLAHPQASLGKAPEVTAGFEFVAQKKAVPPPEFKKGVEIGEIHKQVADWTEDELLRMAAEPEPGGSKA